MQVIKPLTLHKIGIYVSPENFEAASKLDLRQDVHADGALAQGQWLMITDGIVSVEEYGRLMGLLGSAPIEAIKWDASPFGANC